MIQDDANKSPLVGDLAVESPDAESWKQTRLFGDHSISIF